MVHQKNEYELQREERIRQNQEKLAQLQVEEAVASVMQTQHAGATHR